MNEPFHDPVDLFDELDSIVRAQELLRQRMVALQAKYRALQPYAEAGRFDKLDANGWPTEFGAVNVEHTAIGLGDAARLAGGVYDYGLRRTCDLAEKVREYPRRPQHSERGSDRGDSSSPSALAEYGPSTRGVDRNDSDPGWLR
ncbi:hypothetical protein [Nocardia takedensis]|uniref:hypothetical protein n=1 Tax=Nocardia takedensis TaxID=259390 RepID=UPI0002FA6EA0|nr:hypothetical protein [Nocardia takedensis]